MKARAALCAWALLGCATAAPALEPAAAPHIEPQPASVASNEPQPTAEPVREPPPAQPSPLEAAQPIGAVQLTGDVQALREHKPVRFIVRGVTSGAQKRLARSHPEAQMTGDSVAIGPGALPNDVVERHRTPSFLIDSDQPAVLELARTVPAGASLAELRKHVAAQFERVQYGSFWTASRAAKNHAGDCTEHAVLLAAVARALGKPARVVLGYALLTDDRAGYAFGHAWTEIFDGTAWQRIDATPVGALDVTYLILSELDDEGPGYTVSSSAMVSILLQTSIAVAQEPR